MPTPVATAKQCLTTESAHALDEAVSVARGRGHAQTTSLHAVSAFLSLPSSPLRDACLRARNAAFCYYSSPRAQIRALDFALSLSLDRSPASQQRVSEPPISNSLMAAIKRSQANQRRQPDSFCYKQEQGKEQLGTSGIRVEIQHLIVAILDDPIVSRVFNEAGFSSFDIKLAMVRPLQGFWRYNNGFNPRQRIHRSMFLCNLEDSPNPNPNPNQNPNPNPNLRPFKFPFSGESYGGEDFRRVGEVLARKQGRNPLLFGVCAYDALQGFVEAVERCRRSEQDQFLPLEIQGASVISVESDVLRFVRESCGEELMETKFEELSAAVEGCCGPGLVICFGDLKVFVKEEDDGGGLRVDLMTSLVAKFTEFLEARRNRVWLIGCATYEVYLKFLNRFPGVDKDWDLQPLAITSMKSSKGDMCFKSSLMGSFVPFAGFSPPPSDLRGMLGSSYQPTYRVNLCNEKHAQEDTSGPGYSSVADRCQTTLPSWLRMEEISKCHRSDSLKAKDDAVVLRATIAGCHSTLDDTRQSFHYTSMEGKSSSGEEKAQIYSKSSHIDSDKGSDEKSSVAKVDHKGPLGLTPGNTDFLFRLSNRPSKTESCSPAALLSLDSMPGSGAINCQTSLSTGTSVTTDLALGVCSHSRINEKRESTTFAEGKLLQDLSSCSPVHFAASDRRSLSRSCPELTRHLDTNDFKSLFEALIRRIDRQEEAIRIISQTISHTRNGRLKGSSIRGDVWMNFIGSDTFGTRKTALALAEVVCGSKGNLIHLDLGLQGGLAEQYRIFGSRLISCSNEQVHRKTIVDHIADRLSKTPLSLVFLENLHCAHPPTQNSLLHAIRSGKFVDSHGREIGIGNTIFLLSSAHKTRDSGCAASLLQDRVANAKPWPMQIVVSTPITAHHSLVPSLFNKRKLHSTDEMTVLHTTKDPVKRPHKVSVACLDLNLPAEEYTNDNHDPVTCEFGSYAWLEELSSQVDATAVFKPFDYNALAEKTSGLIHACFAKSFCSGCLLEIDPRAMEQVLAAARLSDRSTEVEDWLENVVSESFAEARKRYHDLTRHSVVKLASIIRPLYREGEQEPCEWLPSKMTLHCQP